MLRRHRACCSGRVIHTGPGIYVPKRHISVRLMPQLLCKMEGVVDGLYRFVHLRLIHNQRNVQLR